MRSASALSVVILAGLGWYVFSELRTSDELQSKTEWSALQMLEVKNRSTPRELRLLIDRINSYCGIGLLAEGSASRVWILATASYEPLVKKLPDLPYLIYADELKQIEQECQVSAAVAAELKAHEHSAAAER